jgi:beta-galactosidase/evolved beta-galactosidase subunit alpha
VEQFPDRCEIRAVGKILPQSHHWGFDAELTYRISAGGILEIGMKGKPYGGVPSILPRIGMTVTLPGDAVRAEWFGRGPGDSYPDRKLASPIGLYAMDISRMNFQYDVPQETGNRENTRFVRITGNNYGICAVGDFSFSCHDFTLDNLTSARHRNELRFTEEKYLYIDFRHRGLGSLSCGPEPEAQYELNSGEFDHTFTLTPDFGTARAFDMMKTE